MTASTANPKTSTWTQTFLYTPGVSTTSAAFSKSQSAGASSKSTEVPMSGFGDSEAHSKWRCFRNSLAKATSATRTSGVSPTLPKGKFANKARSCCSSSQIGTSARRSKPLRVHAFCQPKTGYAESATSAAISTFGRSAKAEMRRRKAAAPVDDWTTATVGPFFAAMYEAKEADACTNALWRSLKTSALSTFKTSSCLSPRKASDPRPCTAANRLFKGGGLVLRVDRGSTMNKTIVGLPDSGFK
mmetsp:Transcript_14103/g.47043  ORF Transcript_14103/g.47043 Transcript_14103/m.47043 type:complete len:244 (+) Transcript_14103:751-1482(+)